jgi:large subunit ribosomal protein L4
MELQIYSRDGRESGRTIQLDEAVFGIEPNTHVMWLDVRSIQANKRQGTHKSKERSEVSRSTRKLYRQKGTGGARSGDAKSPLRKGGGTIFGPRPHDYVVTVNRKTKQLARRSALSLQASREAIRIVEDFTMDVPKTKDVLNLLSTIGVAGSKVLMLTGDHNENVYRSGRNIAKVNVQEARLASTEELLNAKVIILQESALTTLTQALGN